MIHVAQLSTQKDIPSVSHEVRNWSTIFSANVASFFFDRNRLAEQFSFELSFGMLAFSVVGLGFRNFKPHCEPPMPNPEY
jgi:hypothetical protein